MKTKEKNGYNNTKLPRKKLEQPLPKCDEKLEKSYIDIIKS